MSPLSKSLIPLGIVASAISGSISFADDSQGFYVTAGAGSTSVSDVTATAAGTSVAVDIGSGFSSELGLGYDFGNDIRTEITWGEAKGDFNSVAGVAVTSGDVKASTIGVNVYKDFSGDSNFTPYIGAGLGTTSIDTSAITINSTSYVGSNADTKTFSLKIGSSYEVNDNTNLFLEGKYASIGDFKVAGVKYTDISTLGIHAGFRFGF